MSQTTITIFVGMGTQGAAEFDNQPAGAFEGITQRASTAKSRPGTYYTGTREALFSVLYIIEGCPIFFGDCGNEPDVLSGKSACQRTAAKLRRELQLDPHEKFPTPAWAQRPAS